ncbi:MAG: Flp pilus assembly protein CpaB [Candidatus Omnitrophota bacterium]
MDKRMVNIVIGLIVGMFALFLIWQHNARQEARIQRLIEEGKLVEVVVARRDIPKETTITQDMIEKKVVKKNTLNPNDLSDVQSVIGQFAETDILRGQYISANMLRILTGADYLSQTVPPGYRAITIPVDKISAIEGLLRPGDKVDIIGTFSLPTGSGQNAPVVVNVFQNVKILATNKNISPYQQSTSIDTITLSLKPENVKVLTYMLEWSKLRLVLRSPLDTGEEFGYSAVTFDNLMARLGFTPPPPTSKQDELTVEVYRGSQSGEEPLR